MAEVKSAPPPSKGRRVSHGAGGRRRFTSEGRERTPKKRHRRATSSVAAFHVFYGGDISDPLNLNSAHVDADDSQSGDDEPEEYVRKPVEDTPQTSEQPRHVEDPLRLLSDDKKEARRERKKHQRKVAAMKREEKRKQSTGDEQKDDTGGRRRKRSFSNDGESTDDGGRVVRKKKKKKKASTGPDSHMVDPNGLTFRPQDAKFAMGNYNRYYGYRNPTGQSDERLKSFPKAIFCDKACLDIGCNTGHVTLSIARDLNPASIIGVDVDRTLVETAEKNVRHYIVATESEKDMPVPAKRDFPLSFKLSYGLPIGLWVIGSTKRQGGT
ncbi:probable RNA methyltransferase Y17G7B.18 [Sycon ciliatum]|uniref:probable RNA methyltransferase Y17G7B.18 n=1 Tax=Sycon ciliatum TaxID=27933 RepID=UPI0031F6C69B